MAKKVHNRKEKYTINMAAYRIRWPQPNLFAEVSNAKEISKRFIEQLNNKFIEQLNMETSNNQSRAIPYEDKEIIIFNFQNYKDSNLGILGISAKTIPLSIQQYKGQRISYEELQSSPKEEITGLISVICFCLQEELLILAPLYGRNYLGAFSYYINTICDIPKESPVIIRPIITEIDTVPISSIAAVQLQNGIIGVYKSSFMQNILNAIHDREQLASPINSCLYKEKIIIGINAREIKNVKNWEVALENLLALVDNSDCLSIQLRHGKNITGRSITLNKNYEYEIEKMVTKGKDLPQVNMSLLQENMYVFLQEVKKKHEN